MVAKQLTAGEKISRDLCEMDAPIDNIIEVDPVDVARRIDEENHELRHQLLAAIKLLEDEIADYTRIIRKKDEENEAANREIVRLEMELASVKGENDTLRRIHKESIDILVKELSDKDYEYNQKTNRLIERHAEQLNRCDAEVKRLTGRKDGEVPNY